MKIAIYIDAWWETGLVMSVYVLSQSLLRSMMYTLFSPFHYEEKGTKAKEFANYYITNNWQNVLAI